jgi:hypothetical protein
VKKIEKKMDDVLALRLENKRAIHRYRIFSDRMTNLTLKIIVSIFVKLFLILVLHLRQFFIVRIFVKRAAG